MCTFFSTLPKKSKVQGTAKKTNSVLSMKVCEDDANGQPTWYRLRLLNFSSKTNDRDYPFIARYVHQKWGVSAKGYPVVEDEVVCPVTKFVDWEGDRYDCPICKYAAQQYGALKESNWKDADASKKNREFTRKFQGIIPVYVVSDPNYEGNNGKMKVIVFSDKSPTKKQLIEGNYNKFQYYDEFVKLVEKQLLKANCFNGVKAVDCCIHVAMVEHVVHEGQPNERRWKQKIIDKITFVKPEKATDIPQITREAVDAFPFDDEYYTSSSMAELKAFYDKHIKVSISNDDIDAEDEVAVYDAPKSAPVKAKTNAIVHTAIENPINETEDVSAKSDDSEFDDLLDDVPATTDESLKPTEMAPIKTEAEKLDESEVDDLLAGIDL